MNGRLIGTRSVRWLAILGVVAIASAIAWGAASTRPKRTRKSARRRPNALKIGQTAPDFKLAVLKFAKDSKGELVGKVTDEKISLSSFRGRQSVVVFFSSYT